MLVSAENSVVVLVDVQPSFLKPIHEADKVLRHCQFLLEMANIVGVPVLGTEQYPVRMGGTDDRLAPILKDLGARIYPKMSFSCIGCVPFMEELEAMGRMQVILIGIETHICVNQTALGLLERNYKVFVAADAVGARTEEMHEIGLRRIGNAGAMLAHTESIAYEWLHSADNPKFRDALKIVKEFAV